MDKEDIVDYSWDQMDNQSIWSLPVDLLTEPPPVLLSEVEDMGVVGVIGYLYDPYVTARILPDSRAHSTTPDLTNFGLNLR
jgi:hypothetical protein